MAYSRLPAVDVAAQITFPVPSAAQLGFEANAPARFVQVPHELPLNTLTAMVALLLIAAHTTTPDEALTHDGFPNPVAVPVAVNARQLPQAAGLSPSPASSIRHIQKFFITLPTFFDLERGARHACASAQALSVDRADAVKGVPADFSLNTQIIATAVVKPAPEALRGTMSLILGRTGAA